MVDRRDTPELSPEERAMLEAEMQGVRRVTRGRTRVVGRTKPDPTPASHSSSLPHDADEAKDPGESVSVFDPSVNADTRRALRRGDMQPEAVLDLHGVRSAEARRRVEAFVYEARAREQRCVLIITGRGLRSGPGGPVLRGEVMQILSEGKLAPAVLGVVSAPPSMGGSGALLVLLRKIWKERR
jgi:DNA-nicking Smr family endonuclease